VKTLSEPFIGITRNTNDGAIPSSNSDLVLVNGHQLNYVFGGESNAPTVVFLHHGLGSIRAWQAQITAFIESGYHVLAYDRWGYGASDPREELTVPYFEHDLQDLDALLNFLNLDRVALVGHSDGGTLGLYYAANYPKRVTHLVVVAAHIYIEPKMEPGIRNLRRDFETDLRLREGLRRRHGDKFTRMFYNWYNAWTKVETLNWDMRPTLKQITCPTLVVQGLGDEHATPQHARDIAGALPQAELWLVPEVGHMLPQHIPDIFNERIIKFINIEAPPG
jgi:pimeloyl-ACP methyl ester carboxylesterase